MSQLPFFLTVALAAILIGILDPERLATTHLAVSLCLNVLLLASCFAVPWETLRPASYLVIPYLDFVAVAFFREGIQPLLSSASILALFPIFWLCASGFAPRTAIISSTLLTLALVWIPVVSSGQVSAETLIRPLLFPFMMLGFAVAVVVLTISMDRHRINLMAKDKLLSAALADSKTRERLLETIVDTVGIGVVAVDSDGNDRLMNATQNAIHALGQPSNIADPEEKELLLSGPDRVSLPPEARPVRRAINGESFTNYQIWIGEAEQARALSTTARTIRHEDGTSDGAVIAFHDVTDMVNASAAKDDFVANVSHEFRTPLTAIQSYIALTLETPGLHPQEVAQYLKIADRNAHRLGGLVTDLLSTSSMTVVRSPTNMAKLLGDSIASMMPAATANAVVVDWQCQEPLAAMVDAVRLGQVLDNLVSNAVKYSPDGGTLTVRAWADGTDLHCRVSDTGLGMSVSEQAGLFQKFYRAGTAVERGIPGIGLGLMISKTIIDTHGGALSVESQAGSGTSMSFVIPGCVMAPQSG
ncbi:sensor histidine kinase [Arthrobacter psychrolactophilus]